MDKGVGWDTKGNQPVVRTPLGSSFQKPVRVQEFQDMLATGLPLGFELTKPVGFPNPGSRISKNVSDVQNIIKNMELKPKQQWRSG